MPTYAQTLRYLSRSPERRAEQNRRAHERTRNVLRAIRLERGCADCGYRDEVALLHFHHRDPEAKAFNVCESQGNHGLQALLAEIEKCDVLCAPCHRARHAMI